MTPSRFFSWNAKVGRRPWLVVLALRVFIRITRPHVIVLTEAGGYIEELRKAFHGEWHAYRKHSDVVVMVRKNFAQPKVTRLEHDHPWHGPKEGLAHKGRAWLQLDWLDLRVIALHRVPGGPSGGTSRELAGGNRPAWEAEDLLLAGALDTTKAVLVIGDQNAELDEMRDFMAEHNLRPVPTGAKVDWAMRRRLNARARRLGRRGSDHPAVLIITTGLDLGQQAAAAIADLGLGHEFASDDMGGSLIHSRLDEEPNRIFTQGVSPERGQWHVFPVTAGLHADPDDIDNFSIAQFTRSPAMSNLVPATQVKRPWRTTVRSSVQLALAIASLLPFVIGGVYTDTDQAPVVIGQVLAVAATITRVMALPQVEDFLRQFVPWLAAEPDSHKG